MLEGMPALCRIGPYSVPGAESRLCIPFDTPKPLGAPLSCASRKNLSWTTSSSQSEDEAQSAVSPQKNERVADGGAQWRDSVFCANTHTPRDLPVGSKGEKGNGQHPKC